MTIEKGIKPVSYRKSSDEENSRKSVLVKTTYSLVIEITPLPTEDTNLVKDASKPCDISASKKTYYLASANIGLYRVSDFLKS